MPELFKIFVHYITFADAQFFILFFAVLFFYCLSKLLYDILNWLFFGEPFLKKSKPLIKGTLFIYIVFLFFLILGGFIGVQICTHVAPQKIAFSDNAAMQIDKFLFGRYVPFWLQDAKNPLKPFFDAMAVPVIYCYCRLGFLLSIVLLILFIKNADYFFRMFLAISIAVLISIPSWVLFPVIIPHQAYIDNIISASLPDGVQAALSTYSPNKYLENFFEAAKIPDSFYEGKNKFFGITGMPSMHIAWSVLILYFGIKIWRPLSIFLIPYFLLNAVSTLYKSIIQLIYSPALLPALFQFG